MDRALIQSGGPIEYFDRRWYSDSVAQERKYESGVHRNSGDEHVVSPHQEAENRDRDGGKCHEAIAEDALAREAGDDLGDHAHRRQNHDVNGGMGIEPEKMLE